MRVNILNGPLEINYLSVLKGYRFYFTSHFSRVLPLCLDVAPLNPRGADLAAIEFSLSRDLI